MKPFPKNPHPADFEDLGSQIGLECKDEASAIKICALHVHEYEDQQQPELSRQAAEIGDQEQRRAALHARLYDRPVPVDDALMLTHSKRVKIMFSLTVLAAIACLAGNATTVVLFGVGLLAVLLFAVGMTALPLVVGHFAYEKLVAGRRSLQPAFAIAVFVLCFAGIFEVAQARREMVDRATATTEASASYVDDPADAAAAPEPQPQNDTEREIHGTMGEGLLLMMLAADLVLGFLVGKLAQLRTDEDYAAWSELKRIVKIIRGCENRIAEIVASIAMAKKRCMAGILRAQNTRNQRRPPYHKTAALFVLSLGLLNVCRAQTADHSVGIVQVSKVQVIERQEGILIDTSASISRGGAQNRLFREYLAAVKKLLLTEPPNSRVLVATIDVDSFGAAPEILKGWTPDSRGVFTDDLNHARHVLAYRFEAKSMAITPVASGTDIFGALYRMKALFESTPDTAPRVPKTIWILSDMMNETGEFPMPELLSLGPDEMLAHARAKGLIVPLKGYEIRVYGASPLGLTPQTWDTARRFWIKYFNEAGAGLRAYSADCDVAR